MREILIYGPLPPTKGGIAKYNLHLARSLCSHFVVTSYAPRILYPEVLYPGEKEYLPGASAILDDTFTVLRKSDSQLLKQVVFGKKFQISVIHWWTSARFVQSFLAALILRLRGTPVLFICHNVTPHKSGAISAFLSRLVLKLGSSYIVQSTDELERLRRMLPGSRARIVPHPVWTSIAERTKEKAPEKTFLVFGYIRSYKGLDTVMEAERALSRNLKFKIQIVGEVWGGSIRKDLQSWATQSSRVELKLRYATEVQMSEYFSQASAVILPHTEATGSGILANAQEFGKPVIASRIPAFTDVVRENVDGLLFEPGDADSLRETIEKYISNESLLLEPWIGLDNKVSTWDSLARSILDLSNE